MTKPKWLDEAIKHIGLAEKKGASHSSEILQMWKDIKRSGIKDDETPWCAAFVGAMLERVGVKSTRFESAKSYLQWGEALTAPVLGCIVTFTRDGGGHVGFLVGFGPNGSLLILGGNQSDGVNVKAFQVSRVTGYRWPLGVSKPSGSVPVMATGGPIPLSVRES